MKESSLLMEEQFLSKHRQQRLNWIVIVAVVINGSAVLMAVGAVFYAVESFLKLKIPASECIFTLGTGVPVGVLFGYLLWGIFRRMLAVREIRLLAEERVEIITWLGRRFIVKMPEDVNHAVLDKEMLTVAFKVEKRIFVIDSANFTDSATVNHFLKGGGGVVR